MACLIRAELEAAGSWTQFVRDRTAAKVAGAAKPKDKEYLPGGPQYERLVGAGLLRFGKVKAIMRESDAPPRPKPVTDKEAEDFLDFVSRSPAPVESATAAKAAAAKEPEASAGPGAVPEAALVGKTSLREKVFEATGGFKRLVAHVNACQLGSRELSAFYASFLDFDDLKAGRQFQDAGREADEVIEDLLRGAPGGILQPSSAGDEGERAVEEVGEGAD